MSENDAALEKVSDAFAGFQKDLMKKTGEFMASLPEIGKLTSEQQANACVWLTSIYLKQALFCSADVMKDNPERVAQIVNIFFGHVQDAANAAGVPVKVGEMTKDELEPINDVPPGIGFREEEICMCDKCKADRQARAN